MKISACLIVKDDSEFAKVTAAIDSLRNHVDGIYLTTTGKEVAKIKTIEGVVHSHFDWVDDFSAARNFNFAQAPQDSDFLFWIDVDDVLINGAQLRQIAELAKETGKDVVFLSYWYSCTFNGEPSPKTMVDINMVQMRERLLRPGVTVWKGRLHETPVPVPNAKNQYTTVPYKDDPQPPYEFSVAVMHTSEDDVLPEKTVRNKRILELQLADERAVGEADPRTLIYLMKIYAEMDDKDDWEKVIPMGEEYLEKSGWDEERGAAWEQMGIVYGCKENHAKAVECFHNAIREWPHQILFYLRLATAYYNLKNYKALEHWLDVASRMDIEKRLTASPINIHAIKAMFLELLMNFNYYGRKDVNKALEAAKMLMLESPTPENKQMVDFLNDLVSLNEACRHTDQLAQYLDDIGQGDVIPKMLDALPPAITEQPFSHRLRAQYTKPRVWEDNEICYLASFGQKHFEEWGPSSLEKGIGGSETAVIRLAEEWGKLGYKVTVYGDPGAERGTVGNVTYLPWYCFNKNDEFNIFIQWRNWAMAGEVKAKKFLVDLHDVYSQVDISDKALQHVDKFMVKSAYHRALAPKVPDEKFAIISNGI